MYSIPNMLKAGLWNYPEVNQSLLDELKIQADVTMYTQLPEYDDLHGFDLSIDSERERESERARESERERERERVLYQRSRAEFTEDYRNLPG